MYIHVNKPHVEPQLGMALTAKMFFIVLLAMLADCQSENADYYRPNPRYECATQNCTTSAAAGLSLGSSCILGRENLLCRCDKECKVFGDCCVNTSNCDATDVERSTASELDGLQCRSVHLDTRTKPGWMESFWMVSACPTHWLAGRDDRLLLDTLNNCTNGGNNLPPVTDIDNGIVYKNEYCAVCHEVENIQPWRYRLECTPSFYSMFRSRDFQLTEEIVEQECITCGFSTPLTPPTTPPARACLHDSLVDDTCLGREELQNKAGMPIEEERYQEMVRLCHSGPISPVVLGGIPIPRFVFPFRNQHCAICNGVRVATEILTCVDPYLYRNSTNHCRQSLMSMRSPTTPTSTPATLAPRPSRPPTTFRPSRPPTTLRPSGNGTFVNPINLRPSGNGTFADIVPRLGFFVPEAATAPVPEPFFPFPIFLDVNGDTQVVHAETVSVTIPTSCTYGQVFDPITDMCRMTICPESTRGEPCTIVQNITLIRGPNNSTQNDSLPCDGVPISPENTEFELLDNDTLLFHDEVFDIIGYFNSLPIICTNLTQNGTRDINVTVLSYSYPTAFSTLTNIGCSLSLIGCAFVLFTYCLFKELQTLPGKILMNLAASILGTCVFLLIGIPLFALSEREELCHTTAIFLHWLVLSQFSWMTIMSYELARSLFRATRLKSVQTKKVQNKILLVYLLVGWGLPTVITGVCVVVNYSTDYIRYGEDGFCWISHVDAIYIVFMVPIAISILFNGIAFFIAVNLLFRASRTQAKVQKQNTISYFRIYLSIFSITGLTWVSGFVAILARGEWAWYLFIIFTTTQGFTICAAFLFTQKVGSLYKQFFWPRISGTFSFKSKITQDTSMAIRYTRKGENVSTVSSDFTSGKGTDAGPTTDQEKHEEAQQVAVHAKEEHKESDDTIHDTDAGPTTDQEKREETQHVAVHAKEEHKESNDAIHDTENS